MKDRKPSPDFEGPTLFQVVLFGLLIGLPLWAWDFLRCGIIGTLTGHRLGHCWSQYMHTPDRSADRICLRCGRYRTDHLH